MPSFRLVLLSSCPLLAYQLRFTTFPGYLCLAMDKGALRGLALAMHNELAPRGIFVGTVMVCGVIGGNEHFAPSNIAEKYWQMYSERKDWEVRFE